MSLYTFLRVQQDKNLAKYWHCDLCKKLHPDSQQRYEFFGAWSCKEINPNDIDQLVDSEDDVRDDPNYYE